MGAKVGHPNFKGNKNSGRRPLGVELKRKIQPIIEQLETERQRALDEMAGKISKAQYHHLVDSIDKMTKNIQLLGGRPTEINQITIEDVKKGLENL